MAGVFTLRHIIFAGRDPAMNLALEEHLFQSLPAGHPGYFLLWQNDPSIIIGRHQCAREEINASLVEELGLPVVRRITGGGAVYHDCGNLNFSFIENVANDGRISFGRYLEPICRALAEIGVTARISGRNDLEVNGRKISGSAQTRAGRRFLHHGTLLVHCELDRLGEILRPSRNKIISKGVPSVRARVGNIADFWPAGATMEALKAALVTQCAPAAAEPATHDLKEAAMLAQEKYRSAAWNFGASPPFDLEKRQRFGWGEVTVRLAVRHGCIEACRVYGDFFSSADIALLEKMLVGVELSRTSVDRVLAGAAWSDFFIGCQPDEMREFFLAAFFQ